MATQSNRFALATPAELEEEPSRLQRAEQARVQGLLGDMAEEAILWRETNLDPFLVEATNLYKGAKFGNEETGRSQVVMTTVRDTVRRIMPSLLRVFFGTERVVEFRPRGPEDVEIAEQQTDMLEVVVREDNNGFLVFHSWFKDALVRRIGWVKWWWETNERQHVEQYRGLTLDEVSIRLSAYEDEPGVEITSETAPAGLSDDGQELFDLDVEVTITDGFARFDSVPPEEMIWSPSARNVADARVVGHVADRPADEIIAMGVPVAEVEVRLGDVRDETRLGDQVEAARSIDRGNKASVDDQDRTTLPVQFGELYARIDVDGDGIAELRRFETIGTDWHIINGGGAGEKVDEVPFAFLTFDPEPHTLVGGSVTDSTKDLQRISSFIARGMLDSLANSIDPVTAVDMNRVKLQDVLSRAVSRVIRVRGDPTNSVVPVRQPWVGSDALPVLQYLEDIRDERVGVPDTAAGLNPDVLQSTTRAAVMATVTGAQQQLELTARVFAETGVADLFRGLLRMIVAHQDEVQRRVIRLRNEYIEMDPSRWDATLDVRVNVALGTGLVEEKLAMLQSVLETQLRLIEAQSPIVSWRTIRNTLEKIVKVAGWPTGDDFFLPFGPEEEAQFAEAQQAQAEQPDPNEMLLQIEQSRVQNEIARLMLEKEKAERADDRERDKQAQDFALKSEELRLKFDAQNQEQALELARIARETVADGEETEETEEPVTPPAEPAPTPPPAASRPPDFGV